MSRSISSLVEMVGELGGPEIRALHSSIAKYYYNCFHLSPVLHRYDFYIGVWFAAILNKVLFEQR